MPAKLRLKKQAAPANPFTKPTPENTALDFLLTPDEDLAYALRHHTAQRFLREGLVLDHLKSDDRTPADLERLVRAASAPFVREPWMADTRDLLKPARLTGTYDYIPPGHATPGIRECSQREVMAANGQKPWMILVTMNPAWHTREAFLGWVTQSLVPDILESARDVAMRHFADRHDTPAAPGTIIAAPRRIRRGIRPPSSPRRSTGAALSTKVLRDQLLNLGIHRILHTAAPDEASAHTLERLLEALPGESAPRLNAAAFAERVEAIRAEGRAEWLRRLGDRRRVAAAIAAGLIHPA